MRECACMCCEGCVKARGQLSGVGFLLPPLGSSDSTVSAVAFTSWAILLPQNVELRSPGPGGTSTKHSPTYGSGNIVGNGQKDCKSERIWKFALRLCLLTMSEATSIKSYPHSCPTVSWTRKDDSNEHAKLDGESPTRPQPYPESYRQLSEEPTICCPVPNGQPWKHRYR